MLWFEATQAYLVYTNVIPPLYLPHYLGIHVRVWGQSPINSKVASSLLCYCGAYLTESKSFPFPPKIGSKKPNHVTLH